MTRVVRKRVAFFGAGAVLVMAVLGGRWWVGESWGAAVLMGCVEVVVIAGAVAVRRGRRPGAGSVRQSGHGGS
ncbi:hypothetical protein GCM10010335_38320 [Streptomyces galbus]|nr:hypothetical protein GCM10010335_38320 [Streptomyces galbus]